MTKRLGSFAALFAVPTMIAGIYGMNFHRIPELDWAYGYPAVIVVMLAVDIGLYGGSARLVGYDGYNGVFGAAGRRLDDGNGWTEIARKRTRLA